jgi:alkyldihydroxyacetonephosphate synthase
VYDRTWRAALGAAIDAGATLSHHHGVGRSKAPRLAEELGAATEVVRALKAAWDPDARLNPGALIPPPSRLTQTSAPAPNPEPLLDSESCLAELPGHWSLEDGERFVGARGHTLGLDFGAFAGAMSVNDWLARGQPGLADRYSDPVFAALAGFAARFHDGRRIAVHAAPRRATGPDLAALFVGMSGKFGDVERAVFVALPINAERPRPLSFDGEREPPVSDSEQSAIARMSATISSR